MKRCEVEAKYKWNLDSIIKGSEWESAFAALSADKDAVAEYRGKLKDKAVLLACLRKESDLMIRLENLYVYAKMKQDEDTALASSQSLVGRIRTLGAEFSAASSFVNPEIIASYTEEELLALSRDPDRKSVV